MISLLLLCCWMCINDNFRTCQHRIHTRTTRSRASAFARIVVHSHARDTRARAPAGARIHCQIQKTYLYVRGSISLTTVSTLILNIQCIKNNLKKFKMYIPDSIIYSYKMFDLYFNVPYIKCILK